VALDGERYIGLTQFWRGEATDDLFTGLTAVRREYRRRGVALALKVHALRFARELGAPLIYTDNDSRNAPMIALNDALGFVRQPAYLSLVKALDGTVPGEVTGVG
jgi:GNAT superfamily N-acetyltransferase